MSIIHLEDVKEILKQLHDEDKRTMEAIVDGNPSKCLRKQWVKLKTSEYSLTRTIKYLDYKIKQRDKIFKPKTK